MAKLGSNKRPAVVRVASPDRANAVLALCEEHGWQVIAGIEEDEPEDISDVQRLLDGLGTAAKAPAKPKLPPKINGNDYCPCRSGKKFKKCCGAPAGSAPA
jgi:SWIM/SEC-C metal-binding protein